MCDITFRLWMFDSFPLCWAVFISVGALCLFLRQWGYYQENTNFWVQKAVIAFSIYILFPIFTYEVISFFLHEYIGVVFAGIAAVGGDLSLSDHEKDIMNPKPIKIYLGKKIRSIAMHPRFRG